MHAYKQIIEFSSNINNRGKAISQINIIMLLKTKNI